MENEKTHLQEVGERLKKCRTENFYSRKELAERAGVNIGTVKAMERGDWAVNIDDAVKICNVLGYSTDYILTGNCGITELIRVNQTIMKLPDTRPETLEKMAYAFWKAYPQKLH